MADSFGLKIGLEGEKEFKKGIYTLSPETALLLRNKSKAKEL